MFFPIKNTVALVTGGGSGLGLGTVKRLLEQAAKGVVAFDLKKPDFEHPKLIKVEGDVLKEEDVLEGLKQCEGKFGQLTSVVNCAGIVIGAKIYDSQRDIAHPLEDFKRIIDINVVGTFNVSRLATRMIAKNEPNSDVQRGVIIMTSSIAAYDAQRGQACYGGSKGGVNGMTLAIARDLAPIGIRCVTIAPGLMETPLFRSLSDKVQAALTASVPFPKRTGKPEEFAHLVQTIIENPMLNGEIIRIDGALRVQT